MKYLIIILLLIACSEPIELVSQIPHELENYNDSNFEEEVVEEGCIYVLDEMPIFPGGFDSLQIFFKSHINWKNLLGCAEGKVFIEFIVEGNGSIGNMCVVKGISESYDKEALRVAGLMPNWRPGTQRGQPARVKMVFPITFR